MDHLLCCQMYAPVPLSQSTWQLVVRAAVSVPSQQRLVKVWWNHSQQNIARLWLLLQGTILVEGQDALKQIQSDWQSQKHWAFALDITKGALTGNASMQLPSLPGATTGALLPPLMAQMYVCSPLVKSLRTSLPGKLGLASTHT